LMYDVFTGLSRGWIHGNCRGGDSLRLRCKRSTQREAQNENGQSHRLEF
jgi:hypothetical protein